MAERQIELMPSQKLIKNTFSAIARISMLERINAYIARMHDKKSRQMEEYDSLLIHQTALDRSKSTDYCGNWLVLDRLRNTNRSAIRDEPPSTKTIAAKGVEKITKTDETREAKRYKLAKSKTTPNHVSSMMASALQMIRIKKINQGKSAAKQLSDHCQEESSGKNLGKSKRLNLLAFSGHKRHLCLDEIDERECTQWAAKDRHG